MTRVYRTTIEVAVDRHATLQLPADFPPGRAWIVVESQQPPAEPSSEGPWGESPHASAAEDMEWWDELGEPGDPEDELARRAGSLALDG